ncbi:hypothetical protein GLOIN_2v1843361 [Rhizophagus irregularis DAOM 181602=DAOM 197198]|nr:hypothetical protein GLOIN_2v1843361 [Rhizophagus irregularis DAOM 181602=DAOM 197198]
MAMPEAITSLIPIFNNFSGRAQSDLRYIFLDSKTDERIKRLLLSFVHDLHVEIYNTIWKTRNSKFKEWKIFNNISKKTFQNYRRRQTHNSPPSKITHDDNLHNRLSIDVRIAMIDAPLSLPSCGFILPLQISFITYRGIIR